MKTREAFENVNNRQVVERVDNVIPANRCQADKMYWLAEYILFAEKRHITSTTSSIRVTYGYIRMIYEYIQVTYKYTRVTHDDNTTVISALWATTLAFQSHT